MCPLKAGWCAKHELQQLHLPICLICPNRMHKSLMQSSLQCCQGCFNQQYLRGCCEHSAECDVALQVDSIRAVKGTYRHCAASADAEQGENPCWWTQDYGKCPYTMRLFTMRLSSHFFIQLPSPQNVRSDCCMSASAFQTGMESFFLLQGSAFAGLLLPLATTLLLVHSMLLA